MSASIRSLEGPAGWAPVVTSRRKIDPYDIAYARARRPRQGWQTIASQLRCNAEDLRLAVEGRAAATDPAPPTRPPAGPRINLPPGSPGARVLLAVSTGARTIDGLALEAEVRTETVHRHLPQLRDVGLIGERGDEGWPLTAAGVQAVRGLKRAEAEDGHG